MEPQINTVTIEATPSLPIMTTLAPVSSFSAEVTAMLKQDFKAAEELAIDMIANFVKGRTKMVDAAQEELGLIAKNASSYLPQINDPALDEKELFKQVTSTLAEELAQSKLIPLAKIVCSLGEKIVEPIMLSLIKTSAHNNDHLVQFTAFKEIAHEICDFVKSVGNSYDGNTAIYMEAVSTLGSLISNPAELYHS